MTPSLQAPQLNPTFRRVRSSQLKRKKPGKDASFVSKAERAVSSGSQRIVSIYNKLGEAIGERPYGKDRIPERLQVQRYMMIRDDPEQWQHIIQTRGFDQAAKYAVDMEKLIDKYPEDAKIGADAAAGLQKLKGGS